MAVSNVSASGSYGQIVSAYGNYPWNTGSATQIGASGVVSTAGTNWAVWQIGVSGLPAAKAVTGITITGPFSFGVSGGVRIAKLYVYAFNNFGAFSGVNGVGPIATVTANAAAAQVNYVYRPPNLTSDNLANGTFYLGFAVQTDGGNPGGGPGTISLGTLGWSIYTSPDDPAPPVGTPSSKIINPAANTSPGAFPGQAFTNTITAQLLQPLPQSNFSGRFDLTPGQGLTFASNGSTGTPLFNLGTVGVPGDPYRMYTGNINVAANAAPGLRTLWATFSGLANSSPTSIQIYTQILVASRVAGTWMSEA